MTQPSQTSQHVALLDRCDRCHALAKERVVLATGELLFCGHHYQEHKEALEKAGVVV